MSWNLAMNCNTQIVSVLGEFVNLYHLFGDVYIDVEAMKTIHCLLLA